VVTMLKGAGKGPGPPPQPRRRSCPTRTILGGDSEARACLADGLLSARAGALPPADLCSILGSLAPPRRKSVSGATITSPRKEYEDWQADLASPRRNLVPTKTILGCNSEARACLKDELLSARAGLSRVDASQQRIARVNSVFEPMDLICLSDDPAMETCDPTRIQNGLYLGGLDGAMMWDALEVRNVNTVLSILHDGHSGITEEKPGVEYWRSPPVEDDPCQEATDALEALLLEAHWRIDAGLASGHSVLVHCMMGVSRSATVVISYIMRRHGVGRD
ncbi:unnamed protein product, partial [Polarella glacialis]